MSTVRQVQVKGGESVMCDNGVDVMVVVVMVVVVVEMMINKIGVGDEHGDGGRMNINSAIARTHPIILLTFKNHKNIEQSCTTCKCSRLTFFSSARRVHSPTRYTALLYRYRKTQQKSPRESLEEEPASSLPGLRPVRERGRERRERESVCVCVCVCE